MDSFRYEVLESRVIFGIGAISEVKKEAHELGAKKALVISSQEQAELAHEAASLLEELCADVHPEAVQHVPVEKVHSAVERVRSLKIDCLVAIGGGLQSVLQRQLHCNPLFQFLPYRQHMQDQK